MEYSNELVTLYDRQHNPVYRNILRNEYLNYVKPGVYLDVVNIVVKTTFNGTTYYLITKRSHEKGYLPDYWEFTGGCVDEGEENLAAAIRELREETGLEAVEDNIKYLGNVISDVSYIYKTIYLYTMKDNKLPVPPMIPNREVSDYRWVPEYELAELFTQKSKYKFLNYQSYILGLLSEFCRNS